MAYSDEKKREIEDLIGEGKKAKEIAEITGVSISTVYKMKKNMNDKSVELMDRIENDKEQEKLIRKSIGRKDYETAKELAQEIIEDEVVSVKTKTMAKNQLIRIAIIERDYATAKKLAQEIIEDEEISADKKVIAKSRLITIAIKERDYATAKKIAGEIIEDEAVSSESKAVAKSQLITIAIREEDYIRGKELAGEILNNETVSAEKKAIVKNQLITIERKEKDYERVKELAEEIIDGKGISAKTKLTAKRQFNQFRESLYAGKIPVDDLKEIVERNSETLRGCLFIAEAYKYFKAEELGKKWLNGYKRKNPDMPASDKKAIAGAMDILNSKRPVVIGVLQEQWDNVYSRLQSKTALEGHSDDEDQR